MAATQQTIQERLRESFQAAGADKTKDIRIPGYDPPLYVTFQKIKDYKVTRNAVGDLIDKPGIDEADRELEMAMRILPLASVNSHVVIDGAETLLNCKLGLELYEAIFGSETPAANDAQATLMLFQDTTDLMSVFAAYNVFVDGLDEKAIETSLGESQQG